MIEVVCADIFTQKADAMINIAHVNLLAGDGLSGLIHKQAGPDLELSCNNLGLQIEGSAILTPAFNIQNCEWLIHAFCPRWQGGEHGEAEKLAGVYETIIDIALAHKFENILIPAISTSIYNYSVEQAADIAIATCNHVLEGEKLEVIFVVPDTEKYEIYRKAIDVISG